MKLPLIRELNISKNDIGQIDPALFELKSLKELNLSATNIRKIPDEIVDMSSLTVLDMSNNDIATLPNGLFSMKQLFGLNVSSTNLKYPLSAFSNLKSLENLEASNLEVPSEVFDLDAYPNLTQLNLSGTRISGVTCASNESNLKFCDMSRCGLSEFPSDVLNSGSLTHLNLSSNSIRAIPKSIRETKFRLRLGRSQKEEFIINLGQNPLGDPPVEILRAGDSAVET